MHRFLERLATTADRWTAAGLRLVQSRGIRRAWLIVASVGGVVVLAAGTHQTASLIAHEERTQVDEIAVADTDLLQVSNSAGTTRVVGVDGATSVRVEADISDGLHATGHRISRRDGRLVVEASCPTFGSEWCQVDYTIEVPAEMAVAIDAQQRVDVRRLDGEVSIEADEGAELRQLSGDVTVRVATGSIEGTDLRVARIDADTQHGDIELTFAASPRRIVAQSDVGDIDILLPDGPADADVFYATDLSGGHRGTTNTDIRQDPDSDRTIVADTDVGSIDIAYLAG
jgi:hypothetical protein